MSDSSNVCGVGGWGGPLPGDPSNNSLLSAVAAFGGIDVSWTYPTTNPHAVAHTLLYRGSSSDFATAIQREVAAGSAYYDKLDTVSTYFYWIRIISVNGTVGALIGPAYATSRLTIEDTITQLTGKIDAGVLATSLRTEIARIAATATALTNEVTQRVSSNEALSSVLVGVQASNAGALAAIQKEVTARTTADSALAQAVTTTQTVLGQNIASVQTSMQSKINVTNGKVTEIGALYSAKLSVNGLIGGFGVYNDGHTVEAGFDVDNFWVGKTDVNKRKPFIIHNGQTFIDQAVIRELNFSKLTDETGLFVVENGKVKADYLKVGSASIDDLAVKTFHVGDNQITFPDFAIAKTTAYSDPYVWRQLLTSNAIDVGNSTICITIAMSSTADYWVQPAGDMWSGTDYPLQYKLIRTYVNGSTPVVVAEWTAGGGGSRWSSQRESTPYDVGYCLTDTPGLPAIYTLHHKSPAATGNSGSTGRRTMICLGLKK